MCITKEGIAKAFQVLFIGYNFDVLFGSVVSLLVHVCRFVEKNILWLTVVRRTPVHVTPMGFRLVQ